MLGETTCLLGWIAMLNGGDACAITGVIRLNPSIKVASSNTTATERNTCGFNPFTPLIDFSTWMLKKGTVQIFAAR
jgi:hypothetical protein